VALGALGAQSAHNCRVCTLMYFRKCMDMVFRVHKVHTNLYNVHHSVLSVLNSSYSNVHRSAKEAQCAQDSTRLFHARIRESTRSGVHARNVCRNAFSRYSLRALKSGDYFWLGGASSMTDFAHQPTGLKLLYVNG
jgi:hypothetical protein